ncbi:MAG TPA: hypothetical protein VHK86_06110 [Nitrososphaera sp.]|nr:hypothetical protein [Nitrososphaera sp.]
MAAAQRYLQVGIITLGISGAAAIFLNFQGYACLSDLAKADQSVITPENLDELERNCFIITNSYVYSLFGVVIGIVLIVFWYAKKKKSKGAP